MPADTYRDAHRRALEDPDGFWGEQAAALHWERRWERVLDADRAPFYRWSRAGASTPVTTRSIVTSSRAAASSRLSSTTAR